MKKSREVFADKKRYSNIKGVGKVQVYGEIVFLDDTKLIFVKGNGFEMKEWSKMTQQECESMFGISKKNNELKDRFMGVLQV